MEHSAEEFTVLLRRAGDGDKEALDRLVPLVFDELRGIAHRRLGVVGGGTLVTTELVDEAYLRLVGPGVSWENRLHFFALSARIMRQILVDRARARSSDKRGGGIAPLALEMAADVGIDPPTWMVDLDVALTRLATFEPRGCRIVELVYFAGLTQAEAAQSLGLSLATVERDLRLARAWLTRELAA